MKKVLVAVVGICLAVFGTVFAYSRLGKHEKTVPGPALNENVLTEERNFQTTTPPLVGGDRDEHGCIGSAGYSWCESKQKCLRPWEEKCAEPDTKTNIILTFQPMQCEEEPWQTWYRKGSVRFIKAPTDEELIKAYYGSKSIEVLEAKKIESHKVVCAACAVCEKTYSFSIKVPLSDRSKLENFWK